MPTKKWCLFYSWQLRKGHHFWWASQTNFSPSYFVRALPYFRYIIQNQIVGLPDSNWKKCNNVHPQRICEWKRKLAPTLMMLHCCYGPFVIETRHSVLLAFILGLELIWRSFHFFEHYDFVDWRKFQIGVAKLANSPTWDIFSVTSIQVRKLFVEIRYVNFWKKVSENLWFCHWKLSWVEENSFLCRMYVIRWFPDLTKFRIWSTNIFFLTEKINLLLVQQKTLTNQTIFFSVLNWFSGAESKQ